jgi:hypothetical protein
MEVRAVQDTPTTPNTGCGVCSSPTGDQGRLCRTHTDDLARDLHTVPDLVQELEVTLTRQARITAEKHGGRSAERPLPWNEHAATVASDLNTTLNGWALDTSRLAEDERDPLAADHYSDTTAVAAWLTRNLSTLRMHEGAGSAHEEITRVIRDARWAVDRPLDYMHLGECGNDEDHDPPCSAILYGHPERHYATCRQCGARHRITERLQWMLDHLRTQLVTIPEAVGIAQIAGKRTSEDKLRLMASRHRFLPAGTSDGKPTYRMADVLRALEERYKHRKPSAA